MVINIGQRTPSPSYDNSLEVLDSHAVDYVVIGGIAGIVHGSAYPTYDFDVALRAR